MRQVFADLVGPQFPPESPADERTWADLVAAFLAGSEKGVSWGQMPRALREEVRPGITFSDRLDSLAVHTAYHLGKIVALRQVMGAWPPPITLRSPPVFASTSKE